MQKQWTGDVTQLLGRFLTVQNLLFSEKKLLKFQRLENTTKTATSETSRLLEVNPLTEGGLGQLRTDGGGVPAPQGRRKVFLDGGANIFQGPQTARAPWSEGPYPIFIMQFSPILVHF